MAAAALNLARYGGLIGLEQFAHRFRVGSRGDDGGVHHVGEQYGDMAAFCFAPQFIFRFRDRQRRFQSGQNLSSWSQRESQFPQICVGQVAQGREIDLVRRKGVGVPFQRERLQPVRHVRQIHHPEKAFLTVSPGAGNRQSTRGILPPGHFIRLQPGLAGGWPTGALPQFPAAWRIGPAGLRRLRVSLPLPVRLESGRHRHDSTSRRPGPGKAPRCRNSGPPAPGYSWREIADMPAPRSTRYSHFLLPA